MPDISVISPSLNSATVIRDCIRSVQEQGDNIEHLIIDGHSTDDSLEMMRSAGAANIRVLQQPPAGIYSAINAGILAASGDIIGILHADDFYAMPDVLQKVVAVFENQAIDSCYGDLCYVDAGNPTRVVRYWQAGEYSASSFRNGWMPPHPTFFVRKKTYEELGCYRTDLGTAADYELMVRFLVKYQVKTVYIPRTLVHMRLGGSSNVSWQARIKANRMDRRAWEVNGLRPYPWTTLAKPLRKVGQWWRRP